MTFSYKSPITCDEEGFFILDGKKVTDPEMGQQLFWNLSLNKKCFYTTSLSAHRLNEASVLNQTQRENLRQDLELHVLHPFDEPLIGRSVAVGSENTFILKGPYDTRFVIDPESLSLDEWDRVHGVAAMINPFLSTEKDLSESTPESLVPARRISFVLNRQAQEQLFELADEVLDDSLLLFGKEIKTPPYLSKFEACGEVGSDPFWNEIYLKDENPGWNLGVPSPAIVDMTPRLKLPKSRVLVLGSGEGHDAAFFAREGGHIVTAIDFSAEAIRRSKELYGHLKNLTFLQQDIFTIPPEFNHSFDLVVEHTCYCAIPPTRRAELSTIWSRLLAPQGMLMGVFFTMEKKQGPPFGTTEWEIRERLRKNFRFLFWTRWNKSIEGRRDLETFVLAQKIK